LLTLADTDGVAETLVHCNDEGVKVTETLTLCMPDSVDAPESLATPELLPIADVLPATDTLTDTELLREPPFDTELVIEAPFDTETHALLE